MSIRKTGLQEDVCFFLPQEYANCSCISTGAKADVTGLDGTAGLSLALRTGLQAGAAGFPSDAASLRAAAADGTCPGPQCDLMPLFLAVFFVAMFLLFATGTMIPCVILRYAGVSTRILRFCKCAQDLFNLQ